LNSNPTCQDLLSKLQSKIRQVTIFESSVAEPDYDYLDGFKGQVSPELDILIGIGGGSTLDLTKAVSVLVTNEGPAINYRGFDRITKPGVPVVLLPTTAGTGSEVTPNAVFTDKREMRKLGINTALYLPKLALLDPMLTLSCPRSVTVASGMDSVVHGVESYVAMGATPMSRAFSRQALELLLNSLAQVVDDPNNIELRGQVQLGAYFAGIALMNSGAGPSGAMSYPLGVRFGVPHGLAGAVFLPKVVQFNVERGCVLYADLYDLIADGVDTLGRQEKAARFSGFLRDLCKRLSVPETLATFGFAREDVKRFAEDTALLRGALEQNPVPFSVANVSDIVEQML
jgi:alcohol dehydrogenase class IV